VSAIWSGLTKEALDRAYSPSSMVESIWPFIRRYAADSAAAKASHDAARWATHAYGDKPDETLDLFLPAAGPAPLFVFIHGGYWQELSKDESCYMAPAMTQVGLACAAVNYTLAPAAGMDEIVEENRRAVAWLHANRARLGLDDRGMVLCGHSAGAQLVAMLLATDWCALGIDPDFIRGAVLIGGVYDLEPIRLSYVNDALGMDAETARRNSPLLLEPCVKCPLVVTWGEFDTDEFRRQSLKFSSAWTGKTGPIAAFEQGGLNHFDCLFDLCDPKSRLFGEVRALF
jgi:arylformamidase